MAVTKLSTCIVKIYIVHGIANDREGRLEHEFPTYVAAFKKGITYFKDITISALAYAAGDPCYVTIQLPITN